MASMLTRLLASNCVSPVKFEMKNELANIKSALDDPETGLRAIKRATDEQRLHCARVSTDLVAQVQHHKRQIDRLEKITNHAVKEESK